MIDLFHIKEKNRNFSNQNFLTIMKDENKHVRKVIEDWSEGFIDRDNKFIDQFQTTYNSSFWELYCHAIFTEMGLNIDYSYPSPDFVVVDEHKNSILTIEATIAEPPQYGLLEYDIKEKLEHNMSVDESLYLSTLRLSNSINSKYKKYINGYKELSHVKEKPFIIAVAPFDQPNFQIPNLQPILRILYGVDTIYKMGNYISNDEFKNIINKNGAKVSLGLFTDNGLPEVSAILFSCVGTTGKARAMSNEESVVFLQKRYAAKYTKPLVSVSYRGNSKNDYANKYIKLYAKIKGNEWKESLDRRTVSFATPFIQEGYKETLFDGLHLFLNPFANGVHKINDQILELFKKNGVTIHTYNKETKTYECIYPVDGTLLQRSVELIKYVCM